MTEDEERQAWLSRGEAEKKADTDAIRRFVSIFCGVDLAQLDSIEDEEE